MAHMNNETNRTPLVQGGQGRTADAVAASGITSGLCLVLLAIFGGVAWLVS